MAAGVSHGLIGELAGSDWNQVQTVAVDTAEGPGENFRYDLTGTPCAEVVGVTSCAYPRDVARLFPEDVLLADMGIESYVGLPIHDEGGRVLGLIVLLSQEPMTVDAVIGALSLMLAGLPRIRVELERRRRDRDVQALLNSIAIDQTGLAASSLIESFGRSMMTRGAFLVASTTEDQAPESVVVLDGKHRADLVVDGSASKLLGLCGASPAARLADTGAIQLRPAGQPDAESGTCPQLAHAMLVPLVTKEGTSLGVAGLLHDSALNSRITDLPVVQVYAERLAMQLEQQRVVARRRALEARTYELERLERLGGLAGGIAHDFNNILVGVLGNADYLLQLPEAAQDSEISESLYDIREAAFSAHNLCKQLMSYAGRSKLEPARFNVGEAVEDVARLARNTLGVECALDVVTPDDAPLVNGDATQIRQVVMNLIINARDAVGEDGRIEVHLSTRDVSGGEVVDAFTGSVRAGRYAVLRVRDNGCGIKPAELARIFEPFFSTKEDGHGLGLAGVLGLVRAHDGFLDVKSTVGEGTTFEVYLPSVAGKSLASEDTTPSALDTEMVSRRALIVDDDARVRRLIARFCKKANIEPLLADGGLAAVDLYKQHHGDLSVVVLDLAMPGVDGAQTHAMLSEINPDVPILVSSGNLSDDLGLPTLPKPYTFGSFVEAVNAVASPDA